MRQVLPTFVLAMSVVLIQLDSTVCGSAGSFGLILCTNQSYNFKWGVSNF
jgi:hypothetical protein